ncbi:MAG: hypothetical protein KF900_05480 [Bacteroidetes bacterium]|nr:hypothetical protein [Bacteroidota bacterium]
MNTVQNKLTQLQLELLKSFRFVTDEKQLSEVKSLMNFYFKQKLDEAVSREENNRNYTERIYQQWLSANTK